MSDIASSSIFESKKIVTHTPEETQKLGETLANRLKPGNVVGFFGELGAGKTCMIQGICRGLGVKEFVTSPTFIIINEYEGRLPVYHFDLYRIERIEEVYDLGYEEFFYNDGVCLIEWAEKVEELLPQDAIKVFIQHIGENDRGILIRHE